MKKFLPIFIIAFMVVIIAAAGFNLYRDKMAGKEAFGGNFNLITMDGKAFSQDDMQAKPAVVFFGFTHCPEICPTTLYELDGLLTALGADADKLNAYFVTVDPERDTQDIMKTYVGNVSKHIIGLTGSQAGVDQIVKGFHVYAKKVPTEGGDYTMDHTASVFLLDAGGRFRGTIAYQEDPATALEKLKNLVKGRTNG